MRNGIKLKKDNRSYCSMMPIQSKCVLFVHAVLKLAASDISISCYSFAQPKLYVLTKYQNLAAIFSGGSETLSIYLIKPEQKPLCILSNGSVYFKQSGMIGVREWNDGSDPDNKYKM